jgi:hypothetical protein
MHAGYRRTTSVVANSWLSRTTSDVANSWPSTCTYARRLHDILATLDNASSGDTHRRDSYGPKGRQSSTGSRIDFWPERDTAQYTSTLHLRLVVVYAA